MSHIPSIYRTGTDDGRKQCDKSNAAKYNKPLGVEGLYSTCLIFIPSGK